MDPRLDTLLSSVISLSVFPFLFLRRPSPVVPTTEIRILFTSVYQLSLLSCSCYMHCPNDKIYVAEWSTTFLWGSWNTDCVSDFSQKHFFCVNLTENDGRDSSVGIATRYGLDGPGIEFRWGGEIFPHPSRPALGPTQPPV